VKKGLFAVAGVVLTGGIIGMSYFDVEQTQKSEEPVTEVSAETTEPDQVTPPTQRTIETNGEYPWNFFDAKDLKAEIDKGGQAYLMADAEALEKQALGFLANPVGNNVSDTYGSFGKHFENFVADLSEFYPENQSYFLKLSEAANALVSNQPADAMAKLKEAQALRK
jgi:hypothetical protein